MTHLGPAAFLPLYLIMTHTMLMIEISYLKPISLFKYVDIVNCTTEHEGFSVLSASFWIEGHQVKCLIHSVSFHVEKLPVT